MKRTLFSASAEAEPQDCAQCGKRMIFGVIRVVDIGPEKFRVCSQKCEKELLNTKVAQSPMELSKAYGGALGTYYRGVGAIMLPGWIVVAHNIESLRDAWGLLSKEPLDENIVRPLAVFVQKDVTGG